MISILVIDDSPEDRELLEYQLTTTGKDVDVVLCSDGMSAVERIKSRRFDCVLLDLRLDGEDGLEVLANIRGFPLQPPVIVLTGQGSEKTAVEAFVGGAAYYLPKQSLDADTLWTALNRVLEQGRTARELETKRDAIERTKRLEAVGQLTAGIAHEFNNQLSALKYCHELLKRSVQSDRAHGQLDTANSIIEQSALLAARLITLSPASKTKTDNVPMKLVFSDLASLLQTSRYGKAKVRIQTPSDTTFANCERGQLLNALWNLVVNADEAIGAERTDGVLNISASHTEHEVWITVKDNGVGMSEDALSKCTEPFFTTKELGDGAGLGLAMVQGFVNESKGSLFLKSVLGEGTEATLVLPRGHGAPGHIDKSAHDASATKSMARLLIVEDQAMLAVMMKEFLEPCGYDAKIAVDSAAALEQLRTEPFDMLITDIQIPGMDGFQLAKTARTFLPKLPVVYLTSYAEHTPETQQHVQGPILLKPVIPEELLSVVQTKLKVAEPTQA